MNAFGLAKLEAFVDCCSGGADKIKFKYLRLLLVGYDILSSYFCAKSKSIPLGCFSYDGWSARLGAAISGTNFHYIDTYWKLRTIPHCFFNTENIGKTANEYESITSTALKLSNKLDKDVLVFLYI